MSLASMLGVEKMPSEKIPQHIPDYRALENGSNQIVCSCGWQSPAVDEQKNFTLGRKQRSPESFFEEHKALACQEVETGMEDPARERAVTPAHNPKSKKPRR